MNVAPWFGMAAVCLFAACSEQSDDGTGGQGGVAGDMATAGSGGAGGDESPEGSTSSTSSTSSTGSPAGTGGGGGSPGTGGGGGSPGTGGGGGAPGTGGGGGAPGTGGAGGNPDEGSRCDPAESRANRDLVGKAIDELFIDKDITAADRYWADPYLQHNPIARSGVATFRSIMGGIVSSPSFNYQRLRTFAECDLVVVQGRYSQTGVIFDMFRVKDGKIMEHWDSDANQATETTGPTEIQDEALTGQNRALVLGMIDAVLVDGEHARASEFLGAGYVEHRDTSASGPAALVEYVGDEDISYAEVHHVIADGNFVFTLSEGSRNGTAYGFYDLFRVEGGDIVEHWDSRRVVPSSTMSGLEIF
ncbi:nuclear transport factor 2 family protein [Sorangium sp. So ce887]|uniref:nuclear transport factor 2 family protein n=1 Tax=Sorangium sp. So ce887 TaxID=3133324 RepID=UPI003F631859